MEYQAIVTIIHVNNNIILKLSTRRKRRTYRISQRDRLELTRRASDEHRQVQITDDDIWILQKTPAGTPIYGALLQPKYVPRSFSTVGPISMSSAGY
jgi:hypothetical protein